MSNLKKKVISKLKNYTLLAGISKNLELPLFFNYRRDLYLSLLAAAIIGNFSAVIVHYAAYTV